MIKFHILIRDGKIFCEMEERFPIFPKNTFLVLPLPLFLPSLFSHIFFEHLMC